MDSQLNPPCCVRICSNMLWILSPDIVNPLQSTTRPQGYKDVACWVIKVFLKWSLGTILDPQGSKSCQVPTTLKSSTDDLQSPLWLAWSFNQNLNPGSPWGMGGAAVYSQSQLAWKQHLDLIKVSTCVWLAPATLREELLKSMPAFLL